MGTHQNNKVFLVNINNFPSAILRLNDWNHIGIIKYFLFFCAQTPEVYYFLFSLSPLYFTTILQFVYVYQLLQQTQILSIPQSQSTKILMAEPNKIYTYTNSRQISSISQLPVPNRERSCTDIFCTVTTTIFAITMLVIAFVVFDISKLVKVTYPTDGNGRRCTLDHDNFDYLYFASTRNIAKRMCVSQCPIGNEDKLNCLPLDNLGCSKNSNPDFEVQIYASEPAQTSQGLFCFPSDPKLKEVILEATNLKVKFEFVKQLKTIFISTGIALGLGTLFLILNCFATRIMMYVSILFGGLAFLGMSAFLIFLNVRKTESYSPVIYIVCAVFIISGLITLYHLITGSENLRLCSTYLNKGVKLLKDEPSLILHVFLFLIFGIGLLVLSVFQVLAYWSNGNIVFNKYDIYDELTGAFPVIMTVFLVFQFVWGLCFLKESFKFIVAGCAVTNQFLQDSQITEGVWRILRFHWGSVAASSFILNIFYFPDLIYQFVRPDPQNKGGYYKCFKKFCCMCQRFFGFARPETMTFINAVGLPYCNSSRWCERINYLSTYFDGSQSIFKNFSLSAHALLTVLSTLIAFTGFTQNQNIIQHAFLFSLGLNFFVITFFVSLFKDLAESIFMCELIQQYMKGENLQADIIENGNDKNNKAKNFKESNVNEGYDVLHTEL